MFALLPRKLIHIIALTLILTSRPFVQLLIVDVFMVNKSLTQEPKKIFLELKWMIHDPVFYRSYPYDKKCSCCLPAHMTDSQKCLLSDSRNDICENPAAFIQFIFGGVYKRFAYLYRWYVICI